MKYLTIVGTALLVICAMTWRANDTVAASQAKLKTAEQRLQELEMKVANLERVLGFQLDNEQAIYGMMNEREQVMAQAKSSSVTVALMTIRSQLELYQVQHQGKYPDLNGNWDQLTHGTDTHGRVYKTSGPDSNLFGPYLQDAPSNTFSNSSHVVTDPKKIGPGVGWYYKPETGELKAVVSIEVARANKLSQNDYVAY